ncbi:non-ribosomal peptide synthetase [Staphylococcus epidermidis]|uniref:non-ribosomal peptide synthetase n=1 Tax=Staphylococcus epidermidis TaxID=1282 RepID=UPI0020939D31|nr:non-ribosomal peptide synthetase [Staphylococcus epidermidis]MCO6290557.1 amino acid adenylation domain-containing protein [Staphylococcus epidermidis]
MMLNILKKYKDGKLNDYDLTEYFNYIFNKDFDLTNGQLGIWASCLENKQPLYNMPIVLHIFNKIDIDLMKRAIYLTKLEYPILNSCFFVKNGVPKRKIQKDFNVNIETKNMQEQTNEECLKYLEKYAYKEIDIKSKQLMNVLIIKRAEDEYYMIINIHHIIFDGSSIFILIDKILNNYVDILQNEEITLNSYNADFDEFVQIEKEKEGTPVFNKKKEFWEKKLQNYETSEIKDTQLVKDIKTQSIKLENHIKENIENFCKNKKINISVFFYSLYKLFLKKYNEDSIIGLPIIQRLSQDFHNSIGYFVNIVPLHQSIQTNGTFNELIKQSQETINKAILNSDYPFRLINKNYNVSHNKNINIIRKSFSHQNYIKKNKFEEYKNFRDVLNIEIIKDIHQKGEYDLVLESFEEYNSFELRLKYNNKLISNDLINNFGKTFNNYIEDILNCNGDIKLTDLLEGNKYFIDIILENLDIFAHKTAIEDSQTHLTYQQLSKEVENIKYILKAKGLQTGEYVGILINRNKNIASTVLAILSIGAVFVPIDNQLPPSRIKYIIEDSGMSNIIVDDDTVNLINLDKYDDMLINLNDSPVKKDVGSSNYGNYRDNCQLAYLIYTSGTTGKPKGVEIKTTALNNLLLHMLKTPGIKEEDILLSTTSFGFDIFILELLLPLLVGAKCIIADTRTKKDPESLKQLIYKKNPSIMQGTPSMWSILFKIGWKNEGNIKILCGGEALSENLKNKLISNSKSVWNMYGPTETTIWSSIKKLDNKPISIGKPIDNTELLILGEDLKELKPGQKGELYIAGDGLAKGYHNLLSLTNKKFLRHPYNKNKKIFKTGDAAQLNRNGEIVVLGRLDNQIKLNGQRIELEEIESTVKQIESIENCVTFLENIKENPKIICFYTCNDKDISPDYIENHLKEKLPHYMIPKTFLKKNVLPMNSNGKIDRKYLEKNYDDHFQTHENHRQSSIEILSDMIENLLNISNVDQEAGFFELGIDSIYSVELVEQINRTFNINITTTDIFSYSNISKLVKYIDSKKKVLDDLDNQNNNDSGHEKKVLDDLDNQNNNDSGHEKNNIAIIGMSCMVPGANNHEEFWSNLINGVESIEEVPFTERPDNTTENYISKRFSVKYKSYFDPTFFKISSKQAEVMDPQSRLLLLHSWKAIEDAGYNYENLKKVSVYTSVSNNSYNQTNNDFMQNSNEYTDWLLRQPGTASTMISYYLNLNGVSMSVHSNCSSSMIGIDLAVDNIRQGKSDYALVGASTIHSLVNRGYVHSKGLNFSRSGHISPFDKKASGMIGGEGVGVVLLKNAQKAIEDKDNIYSIITESSTNNDGNEKAGFYAPSIDGQFNVINKTINTSNTIDFIETHGTGTLIGDPIEVEALKKVFKNNKENSCALGSVKANIGHLDTLSGLISIIKASLMIKKKIIPPQINFDTLNPKITLEHTPFYINKKAVSLINKKGPIVGGVSSFGIGGTNSHVQLKEFINNEPLSTIKNERYIIPVSAKDSTTLNKYVKNLKHFIESNNVSVQNLAYTLQSGRMQMKHRAIFIVENINDLIKQFKYFLNKHIDDFEKRNIYIENPNLIKAIELWNEGKKVSWNDYLSHINAKKISLPTYPFNLKSYTIELYNYDNFINIIHPFVHKNISTLRRKQYITNVDYKTHYIYDHIINNKMIVPGVYYLECMRFAGEDMCEMEVKCIKNIIWKNPIEIRRKSKVYTTIRYDNYYKIDVTENKNNYSNCQAILDFDNKYSKPTRKDIDKLKQKSYRSIYKDDIYREDNMGIYNYGKTYRTIKKIDILKSTVLSEIEVPLEEIEMMDQLKLHPSILEGALQSITPLLKDKNVNFMPYSIKELRIFGTIESKMYAHIQSSKKQNSKVQSFNIDICNQIGDVVIQIIDYTIGFFNSSNYEDIIYTEKWKEHEINKNKTEKFSMINASLDNKPTLFKTENTYSLNELYEEIKNSKNNIYCNIHLPSTINENYKNVLFNFILNLSKYKSKNKINLLFTCQKNDENNYYKSLPALLTTLNIESKAIKSKVVVYASDTQNLSEKIYKEFNDFSDSYVYILNNKRLVKKLDQITPPPTKKIKSKIKYGGTYIIFGGSGELGKKLTEYLITQYNVHIISVSRNIIDRPSQNNSNITQLKCDVSKFNSVKNTIDYIKINFKDIQGIFHCAGILEDALLENKNLQSFYKVINPKVTGIENIDLATLDIDLDFIILFSSISSLGNRGQADYAFANQYLNCFSQYRNELVKKGERFGKTYSINWPIWKEGKMKPPKAYISTLEKHRGLVPLETEHGFHILENLLQINETYNMYVFYGVKRKILNFTKIFEVEK